MASIVPVVYPIPGYVQLQINVADLNPKADYVCVTRVDDLTGVSTPVRAHTVTSGECQYLSCQATAVMWDTEAPLDRSVTYCLTAMSALGVTNTVAVAPLISDTFTRVTASGWGTADTGQAWTIITGTAAHFSTTGTRGQMSLTAVNDPHRIQIDGTVTDSDDQIELFPTVVATGAPAEAMLLARRDDAAGNDYRAVLQFNTGGTLTLLLARTLANGVTTLTSLSGFGSYSATSSWTLRLEVQGSSLMAKAWDTALGESDTYLLTATDTSITMPGYRQVRWQLNTGNTNTLPVNVQVDNYTSRSPCDTTTPYELCTASVIVPSGGMLRLGDPQNPCADQVLRLATGSPADCVPGSGIFFGSIGPNENHPARSEAFLAFGAKLPTAQIRQRGGIETTLNLVTRTFADRDALLELLQPETPLLLRAPAQYGVPDQYILVGDVPVDRALRDHRFQARLFSLPYRQSERPVGPPTGVCGTRYDDLCDKYATWQDAVNAGLSYNQLLLGAASNDTPGTGQRIWSGVNSEYASWNAVNSGNANWTDLLDGP